jgi:hypothetical protein
MSACVITIVLAYASEPTVLVVDICAASTPVHALQALAGSLYYVHQPAREAMRSRVYAYNPM